MVIILFWPTLFFYLVKLDPEHDVLVDMIIFDMLLTNSHQCQTCQFKVHPCIQGMSVYCAKGEFEHSQACLIRLTMSRPRSKTRRCVKLINSIECARDSSLLPRKIAMLDSWFTFCTVLSKACILIAHPKDMSMYWVQESICTWIYGLQAPRLHLSMCPI